ncbi:MAG: SpoIIE family protein phosphatase [Bacteroidota bacterium]|nr:SpoIIE family protein phosphatase [Bacteroidota bacterium]
MSRHSILIVEDEHTLRRLLEYRLGKQYDVRTASNGEEGLERVNEQLPDLIISDIMMPKMDGFAMQAFLQDRADTRAIPFIFLTAKADEASRLKGRRTGVDDYITKPFDIDQLLSRVDRLLERTAQFQKQLDARIGQDFSQKLMPKRMPEASGYRSWFHSLPREHGGGDIFDWTEPRPGTFFITIGDVMGKGLQAKFYAFSFLGYIRSTLHTMLRTTTSPAELMKRVNQVLMDDPPLEDTFASLLLLRWEPERNLITYANAGHCRPVMVGTRGAEIVPYSDIILGLDANAEFKDTSLVLPPGGALVSYTDGLLEQQMASGEQLGEEGVMDVVKTAYGSPQPVDRMIENVLDDSTVREFGDDILLFWLQRQTEMERDRVGDPPAPRWFSPFAETQDSGQGAF